MPFYEYECPHCRYYLEVMQKISDAPIRKCPSCGKGGFRKLISAPVFRLKGSGWYETDFKSDKEDRRNLAGADKDEAPKVEAKAESKAEGKSESKAEARSEGKAEGKGESRSEGKSGAKHAAAASRSRASRPPPAKRTAARRPGKATRRGKRG